MSRIPDAFIDDLLARTDIVEVVNARLPLKRQGKEYAACCPFHDERSPSFTVSPSKQFYHCFGCGAHGSAIGFLMEYDRLEFLDAIEELARTTGMEVPRETRQRNRDGDIDAMFNALEAAQRFYRKQLAQNDNARAYLRDRGVDEAIGEQFGIGYAPDGYAALKDVLGTDERRLKLLEKSGMLSRNDRGHVYDKFRDRVMFPIADRRGRTIAFGGRILGKSDGPKYLNSPETPLFHKGRELYGLWQARQANRELARLIVVEGYMDVIALAQHGISQAVATLGTSTTPDHAELLFRSAPDVYFCFDGDAAGRRAAVRAMESVLPRMRDGRQAFFLFVPEGEDPDSLVRAEGQAGFDARLAEATPLSEFFFDTMGEGISLASLDGKARLAERARPQLEKIPDGAFADLMRQRLTELTGVGASAGAPANRPPVRRMHAPGNAPRRSLVRSAIILLLQRPALALELPDSYRFSALRQPGVPLLIELLAIIHARPGITTGALTEHFAGREEADALQKLATVTVPGEPAAWSRELLDIIARLDRQTLAQRIEELQARVAEGGFAALSAEEKDELRQLQAARQ